MNYIKQ